MRRYRHIEEFRRKLSHELGLLDSKRTAEQHIVVSCKAAGTAFAIAWLAFALFGTGFSAGLFLSIAAAAATLFFFLGKPEAELAARAKKVEKDLPFALMQASVDLNIGAPFDAALGKIAEGNYGELSRILRAALRAAERSGGSVPSALMRAAEVSYSKEFRRSAMQLIAVYENGAKGSAGEDVRRIAVELLSKQKSQAKEFSAKVVTISLMFVVVSAVVPALFQAFVTVGSSFMEVPFSPLEILVFCAFVFPIVDLAMLLYTRSLTPEFLK